MSGHRSALPRISSSGAWESFPQPKQEDGHICYPRIALSLIEQWLTQQSKPPLTRGTQRRWAPSGRRGTFALGVPDKAEFSWRV